MRRSDGRRLSCAKSSGEPISECQNHLSWKIYLMVGIKVQITTYIDDDPQPGIVECRLFDVYGKEWVFQDKSAIFSSDILNADSNYPQPGVIACEITKSWQGADGREIVFIDTASPWAVEAVTGETDFDVLREQIIEFQ